MSKVRIKVDLDIDQLKEIISKLSEDEKEELFLGLTLSGVELYKRWRKKLWRGFVREKV